MSDREFNTSREAELLRRVRSLELVVGVLLAERSGDGPRMPLENDQAEAAAKIYARNALARKRGGT